MKAFDPETGCEVEVGVAVGECYTQRCPACGHENGLFIDAPEHRVADEPTRRCIRCKGGPPVPWVSMGMRTLFDGECLVLADS